MIMKIQTKAIHAGDRKADPSKPGAFVPVTTPIYTAASYFYEAWRSSTASSGREEEGYCYARYDNPTNAALEELLTALESGHGALACASGMTAIHMALLAALTDRRKSVVAANALYGATISLLMKVLEPHGLASTFRRYLRSGSGPAPRSANTKPGCVLMETISNPLLRVGDMDRIAEIARDAGAALVVDNTFATPMLVRPLELARTFRVHSVTKYLAGHGDVLGGVVVTDQEHYDILRSLCPHHRAGAGAVRKLSDHARHQDFPAAHGAAMRQRLPRGLVAGLASARLERVHFYARPGASRCRRHPPSVARRPLRRHGDASKLKDAGKEEMFRFMDALKLVVRATSLGDVHSMMLYPVMSSHRDISPKHRERMGIRDSLVRLSRGHRSGGRHHRRPGPGLG